MMLTEAMQLDAALEDHLLADALEDQAHALLDLGGVEGAGAGGWQPAGPPVCGRCGAHGGGSPRDAARPPAWCVAGGRMLVRVGGVSRPPAQPRRRRRWIRR